MREAISSQQPASQKQSIFLPALTPADIPNPHKKTPPGPHKDRVFSRFPTAPPTVFSRGTRVLLKAEYVEKKTRRSHRNTSIETA
jgi:hypothetical protein